MRMLMPLLGVPVLQQLELLLRGALAACLACPPPYPMVVMKLGVKESSLKRKSKQDLPTPDRGQRHMR
jgi:hypothetical protein